MVKWFNGKMITDISVMMVRKYCRGNFAISDLRIGVNFVVRVNFFPGDFPGGYFPGKSPGKIS